MKTITDFMGATRTLSEDVYEITKITFPNMNPVSGYGVGDKVRLISGIDNSVIPGYHFSKGFVAVCRVDAIVAEFLGVKKSHIKKI
jgi:hypothetical protein